MRVQAALLCGCGASTFGRSGSCLRCLRRARLDREKFDGRREAALSRDGKRCIVCGAIEDLIVHHRPRGLATICRADHARVHHTFRLRYGAPQRLFLLWREIYPSVAFQRELALSLGDSVPDPPGEQTALF